MIPATPWNTADLFPWWLDGGAAGDKFLSTGRRVYFSPASERATTWVFWGVLVPETLDEARRAVAEWCASE